MPMLLMLMLSDPVVEANYQFQTTRWTTSRTRSSANHYYVNNDAKNHVNNDATNHNNHTTRNHVDYHETQYRYHNHEGHRLSTAR